MRECDSPAGHLDAKSRASPRPAGPSPASLACPGALSSSPTSAPQSRGPALSRSGEPCSLLTDHLQATGSHPAAPRHHCRLSATPYSAPKHIVLRSRTPVYRPQTTRHENEYSESLHLRVSDPKSQIGSKSFWYNHCTGIHIHPHCAVVR